MAKENELVTTLENLIGVCEFFPESRYIDLARFLVLGW